MSGKTLKQIYKNKIFLFNLCNVIIFYSCAKSGSEADGKNEKDVINELTDEISNQCPPGLNFCDSVCTDTSKDHENCGSCGRVCDRIKACINGECVLECPSGETECNGSCKDLQSDHQNCGYCSRACGNSEVCSKGNCEDQCPSGLVNCGGSCVDLSSNRSHCGGCNISCDFDEMCISGRCEGGCGNRFCSNATGENNCTCQIDCGVCSGCCSSGSCLPGNSIYACGTGGEACRICGTGQNCQGGICTSLPVTTCSIDITPSTGCLSTTFNAAWSSNGSSCSYTYDGINYGAVDCSGNLTFSGTDAGTGNHTVTVQVGSGPGGSTSCEDTFVVNQTTCSIAVTPNSVCLSDTFTVSWSSNGSSCNAIYDSQNLGAVDCNGSQTYSGNDAGIGNHSIIINVGNGPCGPSTCSANFEVKQTTCSFSVTPSSGNSSTIFLFSWNSNGSNCWMTYEGGDIGAMDCNGTASYSGNDLGGPGSTHTITLHVGAGPCGPTECSVTVSVW